MFGDTDLSCFLLFGVEAGVNLMYFCSFVSFFLELCWSCLLSFFPSLVGWFGRANASGVTSVLGFPCLTRHKYIYIYIYIRQATADFFSPSDRKPSCKLNETRSAA